MSYKWIPTGEWRVWQNAFTTIEAFLKWINETPIHGPFGFCALIDKHFIYANYHGPKKNVENVAVIHASRFYCQ